MRKEFKPNSWLFPMPVLIIGTYDENDKANAMNAAWGGMYDYNQVIIALSKHKTTENFKAHKAFTLSFATKKTVVASDYVGIVSQNQEPNKIEKAGLTPIMANKGHAPLFKEYQLTLECEIIKFDEEQGFVIGQIVSVSVDEEYVKNGTIDTDKLEVLAFDPINHKYRLVGEAVADAFKVGAKLK